MVTRGVQRAPKDQKVAPTQEGQEGGGKTTTQNERVSYVTGTRGRHSEVVVSSEKECDEYIRW